MKEIRWAVGTGCILLVAGLGWIFRFEFVSWFVLEETTSYKAKHGHGEDGPGERVDIAYWTCAMHLFVREDGLGPCPVCAMDLQPSPTVSAIVDSSKVVPADEMIMQSPTHPASRIPRFVTLTPWQQQLIGITTEPAQLRSSSTTIRTVGRIDYDETRFVDVNLRVKGWIEKLFVDYTGKPVTKGDPLFTLYSPELVSSQEEYLLAFRALHELQTEGRMRGTATAQSGLPEKAKLHTDAMMDEAIIRMASLLKSAKRRLLLWELSQGQILDIEASGKALKTLTFHSPASGIVFDKMAVEGMYVQPGMRLYRIAALDTVWVYADIYEHELSFVDRGQQATMSLSYLPGQTFRGTVDYVYPYLDRTTRTAKVRVKVANCDLNLRPNMFADVSLETHALQLLAVPESAVLFSGHRRVVFVDAGDGRFQPREIRLGRRVGAYYEVLEGVADGEQVVTAANFLLDSESKLKNVMAGMTAQYE